MRLTDRQLTAGLVALCVAGALLHQAPRLLVRSAPLQVVQPDIEVSVQGEVAAPGRYRLPFGARVADAVAAAGGMLPSAEPSLVAGAAPLSDGQAVVVPSAMIAGGARQRVSLNAATPDELDSLPGVGPVIATRIVALRPYASVDDLLAVPGIGPKLLERLRPLVAM